MSIRIIKRDDPNYEQKIRDVRDGLRGGQVVAPGTPEGVGVQEMDEETIKKVVEETIKAVRRSGDRRVIDDTANLHGPKFRPEELRIATEEVDRAHAEVEKNDPDFLRMTRQVIANIREYQESILLKTPGSIRRESRELSVIYAPVERVAVYVPGGKAAYPSSVLMTVVPARVAGVPDIAMVTPPQKDGSVKSMILALAKELGIEEIYRVSGVAGLAAVAFGTDSIRAVDKIVGPGSSFIIEAKRQLFGTVGIDSIAGPSEVLIVADDTATAEWVAADMWAQVEHNPGSAVLVTPSEKLAETVKSAVENVPDDLERAGAIRACLEAYSAIIVVSDLDAACAVANDFATEHLQIITADDETVLAKIRNAGAIFLGPYTPAGLGDYYAGPSHVLPTGGTARFFGPLSCNDFLKASSVIRYDAKALAEDADDVIDFAKREGLTAHARAIEVRKQDDRH